MIMPGYWTPLSGRVEPGETHEACLIREVAEEVGLTAHPVAKVWECLTEDGAFRLHWWIADADAGTLDLEPAEVSAARWIRPEDFAALQPVFPDDARFFLEILPDVDDEAREDR